MLVAAAAVKVVMEVMLDLEVLEVLEVLVATHNLVPMLAGGLGVMDVASVVASLESGLVDGEMTVYVKAINPQELLIIPIVILNRNHSL